MTQKFDMSLLPSTSSVAPDGELEIGGCRVADLAREFGTPLFIYDELDIRQRCQDVYKHFGQLAAYAAKAFFCPALAEIVHHEGLRIDATTIGEMVVAQYGGVPLSRVVMHGNNRTIDDFKYALSGGVGQVVIDCFEDFDRLERLVLDGLARPAVLIRVAPGIEVHTHEFIQTGQADSKFGFSMQHGVAERALQTARDSPHLDLVGLHFHLGSQILNVDCFARGIEVIAPFVRQFDLRELSLGGGLGVSYLPGDNAPTISAWAEMILETVASVGIDAPIAVEPGRSIVAPTAITVYTVGSIKKIPFGRTFVAVDGGYIDNPRPAMYGSGYELFAPGDVLADRDATVTVVGKQCESGDVIVKDGLLPSSVAPGDLIATPVTGGYGFAMGSNYNMLPRPAVVFVRDGVAREVIRRETVEDILRRHIAPYSAST